MNNIQKSCSWDGIRTRDLKAMTLRATDCSTPRCNATCPSRIFAFNDKIFNHEIYFVK